MGEVMNQEKYSFATDVWSLGVVLYEAAMLQPPFKGTNICQLAFRIVMGVPEPMDENCSQDLRRLNSELLQKDPRSRPILAEVLRRPPLEAQAAAVSSRHSMPWPPAHCASIQIPNSNSGCVQRLRGDIAGYDKFEETASTAVPDVNVDPETEAYADDFEEASGSEASYEEDFETLSDDDVDGSPCPAVEELTEAQVRQKLRQELGEEALAAAEKFGIISFLGTVAIPVR